jgi:hypothetical protein
MSVRWWGWPRAASGAEKKNPAFLRDERANVGGRDRIRTCDSYRVNETGIARFVAKCREVNPNESAGTPDCRKLSPNVSERRSRNHQARHWADRIPSVRCAAIRSTKTGRAGSAVEPRDTRYGRERRIRPPSAVRRGTRAGRMHSLAHPHGTMRPCHPPRLGCRHRCKSNLPHRYRVLETRCGAEPEQVDRAMDGLEDGDACVSGTGLRVTLPGEVHMPHRPPAQPTAKSTTRSTRSTSTSRTDVQRANLINDLVRRASDEVQERLGPNPTVAGAAEIIAVAPTQRSMVDRWGP